MFFKFIGVFLIFSKRFLDFPQESNYPFLTDLTHFISCFSKEQTSAKWRQLFVQGPKTFAQKFWTGADTWSKISRKNTYIVEVALICLLNVTVDHFPDYVFLNAQRPLRTLLRSGHTWYFGGQWQSTEG